MASSTVKATITQSTLVMARDYVIRRPSGGGRPVHPLPFRVEVVDGGLLVARGAHDRTTESAASAAAPAGRSAWWRWASSRSWPGRSSGPAREVRSGRWPAATSATGAGTTSRRCTASSTAPRQRRLPRAAFAQELRTAAATATLVSLRGGRTLGPYGDAVDVRSTVRTRIWGTLHETLVVPFTGSGSDARVHFDPRVLFPGLRGRERLGGRSASPPAAALLAGDGTPLAEGPDRTSPIPDVPGRSSAPWARFPPRWRRQYAAQGYPPNAHVGLDGLERIFQARLAGTLGGRLLAGHRVLATAAAVRAGAVQDHDLPALERAAMSALGGSYAGMAVINPRTGAVLALAGIAFSDAPAARIDDEDHHHHRRAAGGMSSPRPCIPSQTAATIDGYTLQNANGEACGGTLLNAFAVSCNSVFAPLGVRLGARRLGGHGRALRLQPAGVDPRGARRARSRPRATIGDALAVGSSAIGQGMVQSTPLEMADVAATIAMGGRRPIPTLLADQRPRFVARDQPSRGP